MNWPYAVGATTVAMAARPGPSEPDCPPSPSSPPFRAGGAGASKETGSGSSPSASSSSNAEAFSFSTSGQQCLSTSTSALCFGAGGTGRLWWSSSEALARASKVHKEKDARQAAASVAPRGHAVGSYQRRMSRRLRKARAAHNNETPGLPRRSAVDDDTARWRAEAVASAIAHCKETLRRGLPRRRLSPPLSSPSLDFWLRDRQDEIIASAAECGDARRPPPAAVVVPTAPTRHAPCSMLVGTGTPHSQISRETETRGCFSELEFLETFDGDEELIDRHFITVQI